MQATAGVEEVKHYYQRFIDSLEKSPQIQEKYVKELNYYLKYLKIKNASFLITEGLLDSPAEIRKVEDQIIKYIKYLNDVEKLSYSTISIRLAAILYFYTINRASREHKLLRLLLRLDSSYDTIVEILDN